MIERTNIRLERVKGLEDAKMSTAINTNILLNDKVLSGVQSFGLDFNVEGMIPVITLKIIPDSFSMEDFKWDLSNCNAK